MENLYLIFSLLVLFGAFAFIMIYFIFFKNEKKSTEQKRDSKKPNADERCKDNERNVGGRRNRSDLNMKEKQKQRIDNKNETVEVEEELEYENCVHEQNDDDFFQEGKAQRRKTAKEAKKEEKKAIKESQRFMREQRQKEIEEKNTLYKKKVEEKEKERLLKERKMKEEEEEKKRTEEEEYERWKAKFVVEKEGESVINESDMLSRFISYIKKRKFVQLDEIAANFKMSIKAVIDRISDLENDGVLDGVFDDRGKYLYITEQETEEIIKYIKNAGRISKSEELVNACNSLIRFRPTLQDQQEIEEEEKSVLEILTSIENDIREIA